jgi:hypothetical protein
LAVYDLLKGFAGYGVDPRGGLVKELVLGVGEAADDEAELPFHASTELVGQEFSERLQFENSEPVVSYTLGDIVEPPEDI